MSIRVRLSEEELILNALARVRHSKGDRDIVAHSQREMEAIRPILDTLRAEVERLRASNHDLARERDGAKVAIDRMIQEHAATMRQALEDRVNEVATIRATQQAAAEQMREEAVAVIGAIYGPWNVEWSPADNFNAWKRATLGSLRALPLPTPDLDAIREAARREGAERAAKASWRLVRIHPPLWSDEEAEGFYVRALLRQVFPAAPGGAS